MSDPAGERRQRTVLIMVALLLLAANLRPAAVVIGPVLETMQGDLGMSDTPAGVLTALPSLCYSAFGFVAPALARRLGVHPTVLLAAIVLTAGQLARAGVHSTVSFIALSAFALAGMALGNVLLPTLVKQHFPERIGLVTAAYSTSMAAGLTLAAATVVPLASALGGWRQAFFAGSALAAVSIVPWLMMIVSDRRNPPPRDAVPARPIPLARMARTRLGWIMALFFGIQSAMAYSIFGWLPRIYQAAGFSAAASGGYFAIVTGLGIPLAFVWPAYTARNPRPTRVLTGILACGVAGSLGLLLAPRALPWLWAALLAIGTSSFPMILALMGLRARTSEGTAALSGFTQGVGYLIASAGPFLIGVAHDRTGSWTWPLIGLTLAFVPMLAAGVAACRAGYIEDELAR